MQTNTFISIDKSDFGVVPITGEMAYAYTFSVSDNSDGRSSQPIATVSTFGGALLKFHCPSKGSTSATPPAAGTETSLPLSSDVIVGFESMETFAANPGSPYCGVSVGRYCNRIAKGKFSLQQPASATQAADSNTATATIVEEYILPCNNNGNHLHGGPNGFHRRNWSSSIIPDAAALRAHMDQFRYFAASGTDKGPLGTSEKESPSVSESVGAGSVVRPPIPAVTYPCLALTIYSADGDEGYPGALSVGALFSVEAATLEGRTIHRLRLDYMARLEPSPDPMSEGLSTIINLTNHSYFNLSTVDSTSAPQPSAASIALGGSNTIVDYPITGHHLALNASAFTPTDNLSIPTGEIRQVSEDVSMDFYHRKVGDTQNSFFSPSRKPLSFSATSPKMDEMDGNNKPSADPVPVGRKIGEANGDTSSEQVKFGSGYDHNWCLAGALPPAGAPTTTTAQTKRFPYQLAAVLTDPDISGRFLRVLTTQPGVQFYAGNYLSGAIIGKGRKPIVKRSGLCLETQHFPDSPNHSNFPSVVLGPSANYHQTTVYEVGNM